MSLARGVQRTAAQRVVVAAAVRMLHNTSIARATGKKKKEF